MDKRITKLIRDVKLIAPSCNNTEQFIAEFWKYHKRENTKRNIFWFSLLAVIFFICWILSKN